MIIFGMIIQEGKVFEKHIKQKGLTSKKEGTKGEFLVEKST
ncbi:hypothetical protein SNE26_07185 [Mucilaginibacter sp. cycad4]|nr:hypothetical protein [Mucilaginibacter gossypii]WPV01555.1 hypothetical protein SNE26_07185 [Mucilaginibacter gossypii]